MVLSHIQVTPKNDERNTPSAASLWQWVLCGCREICSSRGIWDMKLQWGEGLKSKMWCICIRVLCSFIIWFIDLMTELLLWKILLFCSKKLLVWGPDFEVFKWQVAHCFAFVFMCHVVFHCWCQFWMGCDTYIIGKFIESDMISFTSCYMMKQEAETWLFQDLLENCWKAEDGIQDPDSHSEL